MAAGPRRRPPLSGVPERHSPTASASSRLRARAGIQNGAPDGFALVDNFGRVGPVPQLRRHDDRDQWSGRGLTSIDIRRRATGDARHLAPARGHRLELCRLHLDRRQCQHRGGANAGQTFLSGTDQGEIRHRQCAAWSKAMRGTSLLTFTVSPRGRLRYRRHASITAIDFGTADAGDLAAGHRAHRDGHLRRRPV